MAIRVPNFLLRAAARLSPRSRTPNLGRELREQATEAYWRRREQSHPRWSKIVNLCSVVWLFIIGYLRQNRILQRIFNSPVQFGCVCLSLFILIVIIENILFTCAQLPLIPTGTSRQTITVFPSLAVPVLAALLGFYLATVGIVLGNAYGDVAATVRELILKSSQTRRYLVSIGISIGAGLVLVLLQSVGLESFGYLTIGAYVLLVGLSGWAIVKLAFGAFGLMNPLQLRKEPLRALDRAIDDIARKGSLQDDSGLGDIATDANRALQDITELVFLTKERTWVDRGELAEMVTFLLVLVRRYVFNKHKLAPTSSWFERKPAYPRWVESDHLETSLALETSTPLLVRREPVPDWLERRAAELVSVALEACVVKDDVDASLGVTRTAAETAHVLARCYRIDDAIAFVEIIRDGCRKLESDSEVATTLSAEPILLLTELLLGWRDAIVAWPMEIHRVVSDTNWDRRSTHTVHIRGTDRERNIAQQLLKSIHSEHMIEGHRVTPDWYLRSALAHECILTLHNFVQDMPSLLQSFIDSPSGHQLSPEARVSNATRALQLLTEASLMAQDITNVIEELNELLHGHVAQPVIKLDELPGEIERLKGRVLEQIAKEVIAIEPEQSKSSPDYFGQAFFTIMHHTEESIATGQTDVTDFIFPRIIRATMTLYGHISSTYEPPLYDVGPTLLNTMIDLLELSGLGIIYAALRDDGSAESIRRSWTEWFEALDDPSNAARRILGLVDAAATGFPIVSMKRNQWSWRLSQEITDAGYAIPEYFGFGDPPEWNPPPLIKMLGVSGPLRITSIHPYIITAAEIIGPVSGESEAALRARPGLKHYFERRDSLGIRSSSNDIRGKNEENTID